MSDVAADVAAVAALLAAATTDVLAAFCARPKAERRRPQADLVTVRHALDCIVLDWMVLD